MNIILLFCFTIIQFLIGRVVFRKVTNDAPVILTIVGSMLIGVFITIPLTYVLGCIFSFVSKEPLLLSVLSLVGMLGMYVLFFSRSDLRKYEIIKSKFYFSDIAAAAVSVGFSLWIMTKTLHGNGIGEVFVGSNNVFDFGILLGLVRSISWGANVPFMSPFNAGQPFFYHFFIQFWASLLEYLGIPLVWAINIPSIFAFSALLIVIYYLPQQEIGKGKFAGWVAMLLTITHSSITFWKLLLEKGMNIRIFSDIWHLPTYPYAGPFDGSTISIFTTLNSYVNQRHLGFGSAVGFLLFYITIQKLEHKQITNKVSIFLGILVGLLFLWNMAICLITGVIIVFLLILHKFWKPCIFFLIGSFSVICLSLFQYFPYFFTMIPTAGKMATGTFGTARSVVPSWALSEYIWENLSILPFIMFFGFFTLSKKVKRYYVPFLILFILECVLAGIGKRGFDQKFYSFLIIGINCIVAVGISKIWDKRAVVFRLFALLLLFGCTISGFVDLMAIKNEFAFPLISKEIVPVMTWIRKETPKESIFVSYSDIIDPAVLSGRKNFFGFFGNIGWVDRTEIVKHIYAGNVDLAKNLNIAYVLMPKWEKNDFPYIVDSTYFQEHHSSVYEDERFRIYAIR